MRERERKRKRGRERDTYFSIIITVTYPPQQNKLNK